MNKNIKMNQNKDNKLNSNQKNKLMILLKNGINQKKSVQIQKNKYNSKLTAIGLEIKNFKNKSNKK